ncbi:tetratricopeptide repeat protein [Verrucomicrobiota bacterium]
MDYSRKKQMSAAPAILSTVVLLAFFGCNVNPGDREYHRALKLWEQGKLVRARASLEKAINKRAGSQKNAVAYNQLGLILWELNEPQKAQQAFNDSRKLDARRFDACYNLGSVLCWGGQLSEAQEVLREASMISPQDSRPLEALAVARLKNKDWKGASVDLKSALKRNPGSARLETAQALIDLHSAAGSAAAVRRLKSVIEKDPKYAPAVFNMGAIYYHWLKDGAKAEKFLEEYLQLAPQGAMAELASDTVKEIRAGRYPNKKAASEIAATSPESALRFSRPAQPNRKAAADAFSEAFKYHAATDFNRAIASYIKAIEFDDTYADAFYNLGLCYYSVQQLDKACAAYRYALKLNPGNHAVRYGLAYTYYQLKRYGDAGRELQLLLQADPNNSNAANLMTLVDQASR